MGFKGFGDTPKQFKSLHVDNFFKWACDVKVNVYSQTVSKYKSRDAQILVQKIKIFFLKSTKYLFTKISQKINKFWTKMN